MNALSPGAAEKLIATRRDLHRNPEVAFEEKRTSAVVAQRLLESGLHVRTGLGGTGVIADLGAPGSGPNLILRSEMDALPLQEAPNAIQSTHDGVMHACGHDGHMAVMLCVADELAHAGSLNGLIRFMFQPAEEIGDGARAMIDDGALEGAAWDAILAVHLRPFMTVGTVGICRGAATARVGEFTVDVTGSGGHGGRPHKSTDPLLTGVDIAQSLQKLVSREVSALDAAVLSIGTFHAGEAANVIPANARIGGTVRTPSDAVYERLYERIDQVASAIAGGFGCGASVERRDMMPAVVNSLDLAEFVETTASETAGLSEVVDPEPVMAGDDVALFFDQIPGCYIFLGAAHDDGRDPVPNHSPVWDFDERALIVGASLIVNVVTALVSKR